MLVHEDPDLLVVERQAVITANHGDPQVEHAVTDQPAQETELREKSRRSLHMLAELTLHRGGDNGAVLVAELDLVDVFGAEVGAGDETNPTVTCRQVLQTVRR